MTRARGVTALLLLVPSLAFAQRPDSVPGLRALRLRGDTLRVQVPAAFYGAGRLAWPRRSAETLASQWADSVVRRVAAAATERQRAFVAGDTAAFSRLIGRPGPVTQQPVVAAEEGNAARGVQVLAQLADLGIQLNANLETRFERRRNLHCTALDAASFDNGCRGGFTPPRIDPQFGLRSGGVVGQRIHVNVDYDTQREFEASNNIQVFYEGLEDEVLRRVEIGNVSFAAPRSRFITGGIPANNFGVAASGQLGALEFGALFAQQKGNVVKARVFSVGGQTVQPVSRVVADRDFESQRFYFVRDPRTLPGYPAVDVLALDREVLPDSLRVTQVRIYRHRSTISRPVTETNISGIQAVALRSDSPQRFGPFAWEVLAEGRDYYLDPSGTWFALASRLDQEDVLAVSFITARGDTVGTFPAASQAGRTDTLELIAAPRQAADVPTFFYEMRNVYRVGATDDITRPSVALDLLVGGSAKPPGSAATFLSLLGLAQETDATTFDQYNRLFPRQRDPAFGAPLKEYFVVFPHLAPFADSSVLAAQFRTDSLYRTPNSVPRTQWPAPLWQLSLRYDARGGDNRGNLLLGGYQIRTGSERVTVGGRQLLRNVDYTMNYEVGQLTFLNPDSLFPQPTQVSVQFEENQAFAVAPTSIYGMQARYDLGDHGSLSAVGLYQSQHTTFTRPPLGFEPASNLVAGVTGNFRFEPTRLTRLLDALPLVNTETPSLLTIDAEIATSRPSPNQAGVAYVETFEGESGFFLPLNENLWEYGSRPSSTTGLGATGIGTAFDDNDAVLLTWQNLIPLGASGNQSYQVTSQSIDPSILLQGSALSYETVMWMAMYPDTVAGLPKPVSPFTNRWLVPHTPGPRWRSITQPLSATGVDLTRTEFLEFWVLESDNRPARNAGASIVFDFGTVFEDAVDFLPTHFSVTGTDTTFSGRRRAGEGRIDTERDTLTGTFNATVDDNGILGDVADSIIDAGSGAVVRNLPLCRSALGSSATLLTYSWGNALNHCTRSNGSVDTEDLNNDQHLDTLIAATGEAHVRFVFRFGDARYFVRDGGAVPGVGQWKLYRIPFRGAADTVGAPELRQVRAVRMTFTAPAAAAPESTLFFALARMRLLGAPWVKRAGAPVAGLGGQLPVPHGEVVASVVSTENRGDLGYEPPPGVTDQGQNVRGSVNVGSVQINEHSLRLIGSDVRVGERAEAFYRFPEGDRNFMGYRELRVWARGRGAAWDRKELSFFVKVGQDENNFYLYRQAASTTTWLPEAVVQFREWHALRADIEQRFLAGQPPSGAAQCGAGDSLAYVACNGPYLVQVRNPSVAPPNLTRVQELAVGFVRDSGSPLDSAELWVDDIRLTSVVDDAGYAGAIDVGLTAADVVNVVLSATLRDGNFRQLGANPSFNTSAQLSVATTARLERLGLERLGLAAPLTLRYDRSSEDPYFLNNSDVFASGLPGLRQPLTRNLSWSISVRRVRRGNRWWQRALTDNVGFAAVFNTGNARSALATSTSKVSDVRADYRLEPPDLSFRYVPGFLRGLLDGLPGFLRRSDLVRGLRDGRLRLTPALVTLTGGVAKADADRASFRVPIVTALDTAIPVRSRAAAFRSTAGVELRPFGSMSIGANANWDRDLRDYGDSTSIGAIAGASAGRFLGMNIGFVRQRSFTTRLSWQPPLASWIRPNFSWTSNFVLSRDPTATDPERAQGDSAGAFRLPTTFGNGMSTDLNAAIDLSRLLRGVFGDSAGILQVLDRFTQLDLGRHVDRRSQFTEPGFDPGTGYMFGFGGLGDFRSQQGQLATSVNEQHQDRAGFGLRLPLGITVNGSYASRVADAWVLRGTQQQPQRQRETDWPNVSARWLWTPRARPISRVINNISATLGYTERTQLSEVLSPDAGALGLRVAQETRGTPVSLSVNWAPRLITTVTVSSERALAERTGNTTQSDRSSVAAGVTFAFRFPQEFVPLRSDVRTNLRYSSARNGVCVNLAGVADCVRVADSRQHEYNLTMDTDLPPNVVAGLSAGYTLSDDRHTNRKFSLFTMTASVRIFFQAGELR